MNLASHWIPLRRFSPHPQTSASTKRWYNLNSFLPNGPEWISPTYLRLVLTQAEQEGYSVFVIRKRTKTAGDEKEGEGWGDGGVGVLPECEADRIAMAFGEPVSRVGAVDQFGITRDTGAGAGASGSGSGRGAANPDQPTVDSPHESPPLAPSPPARRRKRQPDLTDPTAVQDPASANAVAGSSRARGQQAAGEDDEDETYHSAGEYGFSGAVDFMQQSRSYDDEDAALQAALKASMEDVPAGWEPPKFDKPKALPKPQPKAAQPQAQTQPQAKTKPSLPPQPKSPQAKQAAQPAQPAQLAQPIPAGRGYVPRAPPPGSTPDIGYVPTAPPPITRTPSGSRFKEEILEEDDVPPEALSAEEIRRRRLARFGQ